MSRDIKAEVTAIRKAERFFEVFETPKNYDALNRLSVEDLRDLNRMVVEVLRRKREDIGVEKKIQLRVGDVVEVAGEQFRGSVWEVLKLNPKRALLRRDNGECWNITYGSIVIPK